MESLTIRSLVRDYLQGLLFAGHKSIVLEEEVRPILRSWMLAARRGGVAQVASSPTPEAEAGSLDSVALPGSVTSAGAEEAAEPQQEPDEKLFFRPAGRTPEEIREQSRKLLLNWEPLKELGSLRNIPVWGDGSPHAAMFFVGDAPNYYDEQSGKPFSGEAGVKLDEMLRAMGLDREKIYLTHMVKLRPIVPHQTLNNRPPNAAEISRSLPMLEFEVSRVRPRVIVALGVIAARGLLQRGELPLSAYQEIKNPQFSGIPVVVTHHPSYLLRTTELGERRRLWEEMLHAMEIAQIPISEKQRGFFLPKKKQ